MTNLFTAWTWVIGATGVVTTYIAGDASHLLSALLTIMMIDILSGILRAIKEKNLKSHIMAMGILKKGSIILAIFFAAKLDMLLNNNSPTFVTMMIWLGIGNESLSILENLDKLGVRLPNKIREVVESMTSDEDKKYENKGGD